MAAQVAVEECEQENGTSYELLRGESRHDDERDEAGRILGDIALDWRSSEQWHEARRWWAVCWPTCVLFFASQSSSFIDMAFLGHLKGDFTSSEYLEASAQSGILFDITLAVFTRGFLQVLTVLCSQAYGAKRYSLVGHWLQLSVMIITVFSIPVIFLWWYAADVLTAVFKLDPNLRGLVNTFSRLSILRLYPELFNACLQQFCLAQRIIKPLILVSVFGIVLNVSLNSLYIHGAFGVGGMGFKGSPLATATTSTVVFILNLLIVFRWSSATKCWPGWSRESLNAARYAEFMKQSIPLTIATCLEDFQIQSISSFAIIISHKYPNGGWIIGAHNGLLSFLMNVLSIQWGVLKATSLRAGHFIGSQDAKRAKLVAKIGFVFSVGVGAVMTVVLMAFRNQIGALYSDDQRIIDQVSLLIEPLALGMIPLSLFYLSMALLDAMGRPNVVAVSFFLGAWCIAVPSSYLLGVTANLDLKGLWYGLIMGYIITALSLCVAVVRTDWASVLDAAKCRNELGNEDEYSTLPSSLLNDSLLRVRAETDQSVISPSLTPFPTPPLA